MMKLNTHFFSLPLLFLFLFISPSSATFNHPPPPPPPGPDCHDKPDSPPTSTHIKPSTPTSSQSPYPPVSSQEPPISSHKPDSPSPSFKPSSPFPSLEHDSPSPSHKPSSPVSSLEPDSPSPSLKPSSPHSSHKPSSPISSLEPDSPSPSLKPSSPISSLEPDSPSPSLKPSSPISSLEPDSPSPSLKPSSPISSLEPDSPSPSLKPSSPTSSHKPSSPTSSKKPSSPTSSHKPSSPVTREKPSTPVSSQGPSPVSTPVSDSPTSPSASPPLQGTYKGCFSKVFAFGDSYTDTGNAQILGDIASSGSQYRLTNGRVVVDYLCDALSIPHLAPYKDGHGDFSHGVNFAVGGTTSIPKDCYTNGSIPHNMMYKGTVKTVQTQIEWFNEHVQNVACKGKDKGTCKTEISKSLFWIGAIGVNDYARASSSSSFNIQRIADMSITHTSKLMQTILESGAKNILVQGLPPVGCLSSGISLCPMKNYDKMGCAMSTNTAVMIHNRILQRMLSRFQSQFPHCKILYADYWNAYLKILTHPRQYHFQEPFKACCGAGDSKLNFNLNSVCGAPGTSKCNDPGKYMNWDGIHLTDAMNHQISDLFLNQNYCRPSFSQLYKNKHGGE